MGTSIGEPEALEALAKVCDRQADEIWWNGDMVRRQSDASSWKAPRADRFRLEVAGCQATAHRIATKLHAQAAQLRTIADQLRSELGVLGQIEDKIRQLINEFNPFSGLTPPWSGTPWSPENLPPPFAPKWNDVAQQFGISRPGRT